MVKSILKVIKEIKINPYHSSFLKRFFDLFFSFSGIILLSPLFFVLSVGIYFSSGLPIYFIQKRIGMRGTKFNIIKFRTMRRNSSKNYKYKKLNEADGPVFKIFDDPRFTPFGKILSKCGLDELPQLINVIKGEMSLVGPRPLPIPEARALSKSQKVRELVNPGITSSWVINGSHTLRFKEWMSLDRKYVESASFFGDINIIFKTLLILLK